jgi:hypothetical protein
MASRSDIQLTNNDLVIDGGDFIYGSSDSQHIQDTLNAYPGWWKENHADGVGVRSYLNSSGLIQSLARSISIQLTSDGYDVNNPDISFDNSGKLIIQPNATIQ